MRIELRNIMPIKCILLFIVGMVFSFTMDAQDSVTDLFRNDLKKADLDFMEQHYQSALDGYLRAARKKNMHDEISLKIAKCYYFIKNYDKAVKVYQQFTASGRELSTTDLFYYAEALSITGNYEKAIKYYEKCLSEDSENELLIKKIWRLSNRQYLFEDSVFYTVKELPFNTYESELSAVPYKNGIVFTSNREEVKLIRKVDATTNSSFYQLYFSPILKDPLDINKTEYGSVSNFDEVFQSDFHTGPVCFYEDGNKMVFVSSNQKKALGKLRTLQLHFAERVEGKWKIKGDFPFNSTTYSNSDPSINKEGNLLYFSSDIPGGMGGMDLYVSNLTDSGWSKPLNLGSDINTMKNEVFPYLHQDGSLYFSSNGHAGLGGLDIFKLASVNGNFKEVENMGFPINSGYDDFGFSIDTTNNSGYLSSNRKNGGYNDNIYEFEMDLQPYPLTVTGILKFIEHNWMDSSELRPLPNVTLSLIDDVKDLVVAETISDNEGLFKMIVPYYSKYKVRVVGDGIEGIVSFEVPKHKKENDRYDIVVVNDDFKTVSN